MFEGLTTNIRLHRNGGRAAHSRADFAQHACGNRAPNREQQDQQHNKNEAKSFHKINAITCACSPPQPEGWELRDDTWSQTLRSHQRFCVAGSPIPWPSRSPWVASTILTARAARIVDATHECMDRPCSRREIRVSDIMTPAASWGCWITGRCATLPLRTWSPPSKPWGAAICWWSSARRNSTNASCAAPFSASRLEQQLGLTLDLVCTPKASQTSKRCSRTDAANATERHGRSMPCDGEYRSP